MLSDLPADIQRDLRRYFRRRAFWIGVRAIFDLSGQFTMVSVLRLSHDIGEISDQVAELDLPDQSDHVPPTA